MGTSPWTKPYTSFGVRWCFHQCPLFVPGSHPSFHPPFVIRSWASSALWPFPRFPWFSTTWTVLRSTEYWLDILRKVPQSGFNCYFTHGDTWLWALGKSSKRWSDLLPPSHQGCMLSTWLIMGDVNNDLAKVVFDGFLHYKITLPAATLPILYSLEASP